MQALYSLQLVTIKQGGRHLLTARNEEQKQKQKEKKNENENDNEKETKTITTLSLSMGKKEKIVRQSADTAHYCRFPSHEMEAMVHRNALCLIVLRNCGK